jgi:LuxR family maltose regulon positive regulatory protein
VSELSAREHEVLGLLAAGRRNAEIAEALCVSIKTVEFHNRRIYEKLGARSRADALIKAQQRSLLSLPQAS